jgi:membrane associated rhomboid family serine protease
MAQKSSSANIGLPILIVFVLTLAGLLIGAMVNSVFSVAYNAQYYGLFIGFLIGIAVLLTIEYASTKIRRT